MRGLSDIYEELANVLLRLGEELSEAGNTSLADSRYEEAAQAFERAIREGGGPRTLGLGLARCRDRQKRFEEALRAYLEVVRAEPATAVEVLRMAHRCLTPGLARALGPWLDSDWAPQIRGVNVDGQSRAAIEAFVGRVSLYRAEYLSAADRYRAALEMNSGDTFALEGLGEALWRGGRTAEAVPILEDALGHADADRLYERSVMTRLKLGSAYIELGHYRSAIGVLRQGLALSRGARADLWTALARARLALGRLDGTVKAAESAMELDDALAAPRAVLAAAYLEQGKFREAVNAAEEALRRDPRDLLAIRVEGSALLSEAADIDQGFRLLLHYLEQFPSDIEHRLLLARAMRSASRPPSEAIGVLKTGIEATAADKPVSLYLELAEAYQAAGDPGSALVVLDDSQGKGAGEEISRWWQIRGDALRDQGNTEDALNAYRQAIEVSATNLTTLEKYATLLETEKRHEEATRVWELAVGANPRDGKLRLKLALSIRNGGDNQRAWSTVKEAIEHGVDGDDAAAKAFGLRAELADVLHASRDELVESYYEAGRQFYWNGDQQQALHWLGLALSLEEAHKDARWYRVDSLRQLAYKPKVPYWTRSGITEARLEWQKAVALGAPDRDQAWAYISAALITDAERQLSPPIEWGALLWEAVTYLERSLLLDDSKLYAWIYLSRFLRLIGNHANALIASERALWIGPNDTGALDERAATLADLGEVEATQELIEKRIQLEPTPWAEGVQAFVLFLKDDLHAAVEKISRVIDSDPDDLWSLSFRGDCLRALALREESRRNYREQAEDDYRRILDKRGEADYVAFEATFAWAAYALGKLDLAIEILQPLLGSSIDPNCEHYRTIGCCYLRTGDLDKAEECLNHGIDHLSASPQSKTLISLQFAEIEYNAADWPNREAVVALLNRARERVSARPSPPGPASERKREAPAELRRCVEWEQATVQTKGWSSIGANAGLARIALGADQLEEAEAIYRALVPDTERFPEASLGIAKVGARYGELGKEALNRGWDEPDVAVNATKMFERALAFEQTLSATERGELLVGKALSQFQVGAVGSASDTFASAVEAFEAASVAKPGLKLGEMCRAFLPDVPHFWALDSYFRHLALRQSAPQPLLSVLPEVVESLGGYLETVLDPRETPVTPGVTPIALEISANLAPEEGKEDDWPLLKKWIPEMRERIEDETGVRVPGVLIRGNTNLPSDTYVIMLDEVPFVMGYVVSSAKYSPSSASALEAAGVPVSERKESTHPLSKQPGWWISPEYWDRTSEAKGCSLWPDPTQFIIAHLEAVLRSNLADLLGLQEVLNLLERWSRIKLGRELIESVLPDIAAREHFGRVLRAVVQERVPITDWESILVAVREARLGGDDAGNGVRQVRLVTRADLPGNKLGAKFVTMPIEIEQEITPWITTADGRRFLAITPEAAREILAKIRELVKVDDPAIVMVTESADVRYFLRRLVESEFPSIIFQSHEETLNEEDRKGAGAWVPLIAEWGDLWPQNEGAYHAD